MTVLRRKGPASQGNGHRAVTAGRVSLHDRPCKRGTKRAHSGRRFSTRARDRRGRRLHRSCSNAIRRSSAAGGHRRALFLIIRAPKAPILCLCFKPPLEPCWKSNTAGRRGAGSKSLFHKARAG
jgi:hypothetical protein